MDVPCSLARSEENVYAASGQFCIRQTHWRVVFVLNNIYSSSFGRVVGVTVVTGGIKKIVHLARSSEDLPEAFLVSGTCIDAQSWSIH